MKLAEKTCLVTGGGRSIGRAISLRLGEEGANIIVNYSKSAQAAEEVVSQIKVMGREAIAVKADVTRASEVDHMVNQAVAAFGRIDVLVNNAGILSRRPFLDLAESDWDSVLTTNLKSVFLVGQRVARVMAEQGGGAIVNVSSSSGRQASPSVAHYCTSKAGVTMLTKCMALSLAPHNIRVNEICPGLIETDLNRHDIAQPEFREGRLARIPLKIIGTPDDLTGAIVYLASDEARLVTGASLFIDGGSTIS